MKQWKYKHVEMICVVTLSSKHLKDSPPMKLLNNKMPNTRVIILTLSKDQVFPIDNYMYKPLGPNFNKIKDGLLFFRFFKTKVGIPRG